MLENEKLNLMSRLSSEISDVRVIRAMERVSRENFVPQHIRMKSYDDIPLPIGEGQTISQPYIVALMLKSLNLKSTDKVLEVGTGSGYQAAVLAELVSDVITVERIDTLAESARIRLSNLGYTDVKVFNSEKNKIGWEKDAPYDGIIVAAGAPKLHPELISQLAIGGRLVMPVGSMETQELMKISKSKNSYSVKNLGYCSFVPLVGDGAWPGN